MITIDTNNDHIIEMLKKTYDKDRLSHVYLFNGIKGTPKLDTALYLACMLYCKDKDVPCFVCSECKNILKNEHMNIYIVKLESSTIKKEQVIKLQEEFSKTSLQNGRRIYIIEAIDKISQSAANSLLKFIEEPVNSNNIGILLSDEMSNVLPTIISRCFIVNFKEKNKKEFVQILEANDISSSLSHIISHLTNNINEALEYSNNEDIVILDQLLNDFLKASSSTKLVIYYQKNKSFFENSENTKIFLKLLAVLFEDLVKSTYNVKELNFNFYDNLYKDYIEIIDEVKIQNNLKLILEANAKVKSNVNLKNLIQHVFVNLLD